MRAQQQGWSENGNLPREQAVWLDDKYVDDTDLKIEIHRKVNEIDSFEKLVKIKGELEDRFGKHNDNLEIYMYQEWFERLAKTFNIIKVNQQRTSIELIFGKDIVDKIEKAGYERSDQNNSKYLL